MPSRSYAHHGLHGHKRLDRSRAFSMVMFSTAIARMAVWLALIVISLAGVAFAVHLFQQTFWVAILSLYANFATDMSTAAGSWAALTAGHAHHDAEATRAAVSTDFVQIDSDIARLAALEPGPEAVELAAEIRQRLGHRQARKQGDPP